jgi:anti-anti-sigma regulatory factor
MAPQLCWTIEVDSSYVLIRMTGVLGVSSAPAARLGLAKCLSAQPTAIVADVTGLRIDDTAALAVFGVAATEAAEWPGARLVLCCSDPRTETVLRRSAALRRLGLFPTLEAAVAGIEEDAAPSQLSTRLLPAVGAARQARELVTEACARWNLPAMIGPACTVVTELVNNVVAHVGTPMEVVIRLRDRYLNISVRDNSTEPPLARGPAAPTAPGGRGLMMVAAVAHRWGYTPVTGGKAVWAILRIESPARA